MTCSPLHIFLLILSAGLLLAALVQLVHGLPCTAQLGAGAAGLCLAGLRRHL